MVNTISFPNIFNQTSGKCNCSSGHESINECLYLLLNSSSREMFGDPGFGANILEESYSHNNEILNEILKNKIVSAIMTYEKRISVTREDIFIENKDNSVVITIRYYIKDEGEYNTYTLSMIEGGSSIEY